MGFAKGGMAELPKVEHLGAWTFCHGGNRNQHERLNMDRLRTVTIVILLVFVIFCFSLPNTTFAITVAGTNPDDPMYTSNFPFSFAGVAKIDIVVPLPSPPNPPGSTTQYHGTGALLNTPSDPGRYVLTAAHIFYNNVGQPLNITETRVTFYGSPITFQGAQNIIHPSWDGNKNHGNDIAIIKLASPATGITGYDIHRDNNSGLGQVATIVGYGWKGTGALGWVNQTGGTLRWGQNKFDVTVGNIPGYPWAYDFDDGTAAHNTFAVWASPPNNDLGQGLSEVMIAEGDSGGPSFLGNLIAGIHSFGFRKDSDSTHPATDIDGLLNASFGELGVDTRTAFYQNWIDQQVQVQVPRPPSNLRIE